MSYLKRVLIGLIVVAAVVECSLVLTGRRVLVSTVRVQAGESMQVRGFGEAGRAGQASIVCKYFTGRATIHRVFWYAPNNILGRDECPFLLGPDD